MRGASRQTAVIDRFSLRRVLTLAFGCAVLIMSLGQACDPLKAIAKPVDYTSVAVRAAFDARYSDAEAMAIISGEPAVQRLVQWIYLRKEIEAASYDRLMAFVVANPDWPGVNQLSRASRTNASC